MTEHLNGYPYSQDVITRLHERAEGYRQSSPSAAHTADLLDEAAGCIAALLADLHTYRITCERIAQEPNTQNPAPTATNPSGVRRVQPDGPLSGEVQRGGTITYRGFVINYDPPPIPVRCCDWQFWHEDHDGAPNNPGEGPADNRCGSAGSLEDAKLEIDMILEDWS